MASFETLTFGWLLRYYGAVGGQEVRIGSQRPIQTLEIKMLKLDRTDALTTDEYATVYIAFELSKAKWKFGVMLPGSAKMSRYTRARTAVPGEQAAGRPRSQ